MLVLVLVLVLAVLLRLFEMGLLSAHLCKQTSTPPLHSLRVSLILTHLDWTRLDCQLYKVKSCVQQVDRRTKAAAACTGVSSHCPWTAVGVAVLWQHCGYACNGKRANSCRPTRNRTDGPTANPATLPVREPQHTRHGGPM